MTTGDLKGAVAVVTGAGSGIGRATSIRLAGRGATVVGIDVDAAQLADTCEGIVADGGSAVAVECDVTDPAEVNQLAARVQDTHGAADILVNVVGGARLATVLEMDLAHWSAQLQFNLTSVYLTCHAFLPAMVASGRGTIINTSSGWGFMPAPGRSAYAACKAGVVAFSRALAAEVAPQGLRVNVVAPGPILTERMAALTRGDPVARSKQASAPAGRVGLPEEVASVISFLASDEASYVFGQVVHVNGGVFMP